MRKIGLLLAVLAVLGGGAFANYLRNGHLEEDRPYRTLDDQELEALLGAYDASRNRLQTRLASKSDPTQELDGFAPSDFAGKLEAFESFQRKARGWRDVNLERLGHEVELDRLRREQEIRTQGQSYELKLMLRRAVTL